MRFMFTAGRADKTLRNREQRGAFVETVKSSERQGLNDLLVTTAIAPDPDTLPQSRDMRERHASRRHHLVFGART